MHEVVEYKQVTGYPAERFVANLANCIAQAGSPMNFAWNNKVLAIVVDGAVVAAIAYNHVEWQRKLYVDLGGVAPEWRRQGLYRRLWERLVERARELDCPTIESSYPVHNTASAAMHVALGRPVVAHVTRFVVPAKEQP